MENAEFLLTLRRHVFRITAFAKTFWSNHRAWVWGGGLVCVCAAYLAFEALYIHRHPLIMDEFQGFEHVRRLLHKVPYRDYSPYKMVLGYYVQLVPSLFTDSPWFRLLFIKWFLAGLTAVSLLAASFMLSRVYHPAAVLLALAIMCVTSNFLQQSADLRVDMLTSVCGLFSLVCLVHHKPVLCGLFAGLAFLVSQKGIYFVAAGSLGWASTLWLETRNRSAWRNVLLFHGLVAGLVGTYVLGWTAVSSYDVVKNSIFGTGVQRLALAELYKPDWIRVFWVQSWTRNPLFYLLSVFALGRTFSVRDIKSNSCRSMKLCVYGTTILVLSLWHKQPWPYFFVTLISTLFVLIADLLNGEIERRGRLTWPLLAALLIFGLVLPLRSVPAILAQDNGYQRNTVELASAILEPGDTYFAGVSILEAFRQFPEELAWLDHPKGVMIRALPREHQQALLKKIKQNPPKLLIWNSRFKRLPKPMRAYFTRHYTRFHGSIFVHRVFVAKEATSVSVPFDGYYRPSTSVDVSMETSANQWFKESKVWLKKGIYPISPAKVSFWLAFVPQRVDRLLSPQYKLQTEFFPVELL